MNEVKTVAIDSIRENTVALRAVNREAETYQGLVASIREKGFIGTISVRPMTDPETGASYYELVDGLHRWNAAKDAGLTEIPVMVLTDMDKMGVMETQVMMNLHKVDTKPVEFTHQLQRMIALNPTLTITELATKLGKSPAWITGRLALLKLDDNIQKLVDDGKVTLSNAIPLCKLSKEEQAQFIDAAMTMPPAEFAPMVAKRVKEIREARNKGGEAGEVTFSPISAIRKKAEIESAVADVAPVMKVIEKSGASTAAEIVKATIEWVLNLDTDSVANQKAKFEERQAKKKAEAEKRALERAEKKEKEAAAARAELEQKYGEKK